MQACELFGATEGRIGDVDATAPAALGVGPEGFGMVVGGFVGPDVARLLGEAVGRADGLDVVGVGTGLGWAEIVGVGWLGWAF